MPAPTRARERSGRVFVIAKRRPRAGRVGQLRRAIPRKIDKRGRTEGKPLVPSGRKQEIIVVGGSAAGLYTAREAGRAGARAVRVLDSKPEA